MTDLAMPAHRRGTPAQQLNELFAATVANMKRGRPADKTANLRFNDEVPSADPHLAEDLTQNTFLAFYQRLHNTTDIRNAGGLLRVMARQSVGHHYRAMRNRYEQPTDIGTWQYANRETAATGSGYYVPAATGFRTATISGGAR